MLNTAKVTKCREESCRIFRMLYKRRTRRLSNSPTYTKRRLSPLAAPLALAPPLSRLRHTHPGEIGGTGARLSFCFAKRKCSAAKPRCRPEPPAAKPRCRPEPPAAKPRCRPEPPAAAQGARAPSLFAEPRLCNFSYRVSSPPLYTAL